MKKTFAAAITCMDGRIQIPAIEVYGAFSQIDKCPSRYCSQQHQDSNLPLELFFQPFESRGLFNLIVEKEIGSFDNQIRVL